ncbi:CK1 family protein kinase [Aphelenchoides besseyi]|nr:CK1 family protein kinase [Aphelenchoides besseyi]
MDPQRNVVIIDDRNRGYTDWSFIGNVRLQPPTKNWDYKYIERVDYGSFGEIHLLKTRDLKTVVCKVILSHPNIECEARRHRMLKHEAEIHFYLSRNGCKRCPEFFEYSSINGQDPGIIMERLGQNVSDAIRDKTVTEWSALTILQEVSSMFFGANIQFECILCLREIHARGVVMRDITLDNFCLCPPNGLGIRIKAIDFGLAHYFSWNEVEEINFFQHHIANVQNRGSILTRSRALHINASIAPYDNYESLIYTIAHVFGCKLPWYYTPIQFLAHSMDEKEFFEQKLHFWSTKPNALYAIFTDICKIIQLTRRSNKELCQSLLDIISHRLKQLTSDHQLTEISNLTENLKVQILEQFSSPFINLPIRTLIVPEEEGRKRQKENESSVHRLLVMSQSTILFVFLTGCSLSVLGSGLFHHDAWHPHYLDHHDHESHGHDGEWGSKHGDGWGENHADAHDHAHEAGYAKGDAQDWARLDYGGHKNHASGDSYAHGYANEHGDGHGGEAGWANGHDGAHSHHSAHAHRPHHFDGHHGHFDAPHYFGGHHGHFPHHFDDHHLDHDWH